MIEQRQAVATLLERPSTTRIARARRVSPRPQIPRTLPSLRERTRAENRDRYRASPLRNLALEFRCECGRPACCVRLPLEVERHRRSDERFIVGLAHRGGDIVVGVADHFLVVEGKRRRAAATLLSPP
jgi:hypothetical protein